MESVWKAGKWCACVLACVFGLSAFAARIAAQAAGQGSADSIQALFVSDIHFEPFRDPGKAAHLAASPVGEWNDLLAAPATADAEAQFTKLQQTCHARGDDTTDALFQSSLRAIHAQANGAKFVIVSGDLIAHSFSCKYATLFPKSTPAEFRAFVEKTIAYVMSSLRNALPGVPVYAALGNNDSDCGDYQLDAHGAFLTESGELFAADLHGAERSRAMQTFAAGGYYSVDLPAPVEHTRLLVLDDLFMSERYQTCGGKEDRAPAAAQIEWLRQQLDEARAKREKVWVMAHIPPGVNAYATAMKGKDICAKGEPQMFLSSGALPDLLAGYGDVIQLAIFAHTHMDEVRLLIPANGDAAHRPVAVKMVASISPIDGNNPSFTLATIDPTHAILADYRVIAASNQTGIDTNWTEEYDFTQTYHEPAFTAATVGNLIASFKADPMAQTPASQSYLRNYMTGVDLRALALFWQPYVCSLTNDAADAFKGCVCGK
ncbi:MAG: metallophosphoesterase [Terracidiphilus sp.]